MRKFFYSQFGSIAVILGSWITLTYTLYFYQINTQLADTTFIAQILQNFRHTPIMQTSMGNSIVESMDIIWGKPADYVCTLPLTTHFTNMPWFHYYFALYLLMPLAWIINIPILLAGVQAAIYLSVLLFTYYFARKHNLSRLGAILLLALVAQHPLWIEGLYGQFYVNRLFLPFSALFIWLIEKKKINYYALALAGIMAISTNEVYGIAIATIIVSYFWINKVVDRKLCLLAGAFIIYSFVSMSLIQRNLGLTLPQTDFLSKTAGGGIGTLISRLTTDLLDQKTLIFLGVNLVSIGVLAILSVRSILPFFLILLPNLFINIGGAEKTGWSTHYHASYFVPLIWLSILGISRLNKHRRLQLTLLVGFIILTAWINPYTGKLRDTPRYSFRDIYQKSRTYPSLSPVYLNFRERLEMAVGERQSVSLLEPLAYHLYSHQTYYYPHNIESVDSVILRYDPSEVGDERYSSISYGKQFDPLMDACILDRMKKDGYKLDNPTIVDDWAVIKRK